MFSSQVVLVASQVSQQTRQQLADQGATVLTTHQPGVTLGVVADNDGSEAIPAHQRLKAARLPVATEAWVRASLSAGSPISLRYPFVVWDPQFLHGVIVTTSQLRPAVRRNVRACVRFFGGHFRRDLVAGTTVLICGGGGGSPKMVAARAHGIPCETLPWFQKSVDRSQLLPFTNQHVADLALHLLDEVLALGPPKASRKRPASAMDSVSS